MPDKLMVVAHPDDEIIFGGAHLLWEKHWKVICVTNSDNQQRAAEFRTVMRLVGADCEIWNYPDTYSSNFSTADLRRDLQRVIRQNGFNKVVTHGLSGEYGHPQHKVIARLMRGIVNHNLYAFSIGQTRLPTRILARKMQLLDVYLSQRDTIWELCRDVRLYEYIDKEHFVLIKK